MKKIYHFNMRYFFIYSLVLCLGFIYPSKANNIEEFQIEEMNVGGSLLDFFSLSELRSLANHRSTFSYNNSKAKIIRTHRDEPARKGERKASFYDFVGATVLDEVNYKIIGVQGYIRFKKIDDCNKERLKIELDIEKTLNIKAVRETKKHAYDKTSTSYNSWFRFKNNEVIGINCTDWQEKYRINNNWMPNLKVSIVSSELNEVMKKSY